MLPDLVPNHSLVQKSAYLQDQMMYFLQCAMEESCVSRGAYYIQATDPSTYMGVWGNGRCVGEWKVCGGMEGVWGGLGVVPSYPQSPERAAPTGKHQSLNLNAIC